MDYTISGLQPKITGGEWELGEKWLLFDTSGTFSIDKDITANIYLVGGGCTGGRGSRDSVNFALGGNGGDGGYVYCAQNVKISKNTDCNITVANAVDKAGTSIEIEDLILNCGNTGYFSATGGNGGSVYRGSSGTSKRNASNGYNGVITPYGYVGSSGGGGGAYYSVTSATYGTGGTGAGSGGDFNSGKTATNYGCGGGGGGCNGNVTSANYAGGAGVKGCVIICIIKEDESKPKFKQDSFDYNGLIQDPTIGDNIENFDDSFMEISGTTSGKNASTYTIYISLKEGYYWEDGTNKEVELTWTINPIKIPKPTVAPLAYDYTGSVSYSDTHYKLPTITYSLPEGVIPKNIITTSGTGTARQYKANDYTITFSINDPDSCSWEDGDTRDYTSVTWKINPIVVEIPKVTSGDFTYDGKSYGTNVTSEAHKVVVENVDFNIMTQGGDYNSKTNVGNYSITYTLRDPDSCSWIDGTTTPKTVYWNINKRTIYIDVPYLEPNQAEFTYDGTEHTPVVTNLNNTYMSVTGTTSSTSANTEDQPFWEIHISLKTATNDLYLWNIEDEEEQTKDVVLKWVVHKGIIEVT